MQQKTICRLDNYLFSGFFGISRDTRIQTSVSFFNFATDNPASFPSESAPTLPLPQIIFPTLIAVSLVTFLCCCYYCCRRHHRHATPENAANRGPIITLRDLLSVPNIPMQQLVNETEGQLGAP